MGTPQGLEDAMTKNGLFAILKDPKEYGIIPRARNVSIAERSHSGLAPKGTLWVALAWKAKSSIENILRKYLESGEVA